MEMSFDGIDKLLDRFEKLGEITEKAENDLKSIEKGEPHQMPLQKGVKLTPFTAPDEKAIKQAEYEKGAGDTQTIVDNIIKEIK